MNIRVSVCESEAAEASNMFFPVFFKNTLRSLPVGKQMNLFTLTM